MSTDSLPPFVSKLFKMVSDKNLHEYITWNNSQNGICVNNVLDFSQQILPRYFKHNNFCSFVRQLNTYGFRKVESSSNWEFQHDHFKPDEASLRKVVRRKSAKRTSDDEHVNAESPEINTSIPPRLLSVNGRDSIDLRPVDVTQPYLGERDPIASADIAISSKAKKAFVPTANGSATATANAGSSVIAANVYNPNLPVMTVPTTCPPETPCPIIATHQQQQQQLCNTNTCPVVVNTAPVAPVAAARVHTTNSANSMAAAAAATASVNNLASNCAKAAEAMQSDVEKVKAVNELLMQEIVRLQSQQTVINNLLQMALQQLTEQKRKQDETNGKLELLSKLFFGQYAASTSSPASTPPTPATAPVMAPPQNATGSNQSPAQSYTPSPPLTGYLHTLMTSNANNTGSESLLTNGSGLQQQSHPVVYSTELTTQHPQSDTKQQLQPQQHQQQYQQQDFGNVPSEVMQQFQQFLQFQQQQQQPQEQRQSQSLGLQSDYNSLYDHQLFTSDPLNAASEGNQHKLGFGIEVNGSNEIHTPTDFLDLNDVSSLLSEGILHEPM